MKELGDSYVRSEFKQHKKAKVGEVKVFARQWKEYLYTIEAQAATGTFGRNLREEEAAHMNQEQKENLKRLEEEAKRAGEN